MLDGGSFVIIEINTLSQSPIYEQLRDQVVFGIASKQLMPGEALPSVRRLASDLGINLHTVNKSYALLCEEGYIVLDRRKGALVSRTLEGGEEISAMLSDKLLLTAAEAICHKISEKEFVGLCSDNYRKALGSTRKGEG